MRILIGMANLRETGALTMGRGFLKGVSELGAEGLAERDVELFVLHPATDVYRESLPGFVRSLPIDAGAGLLDSKLRTEQWLIPRLIRKHGINALLSMNSLSTWVPPCPHVVFVHLPHLAYHYHELDFKKALRFTARYFLRIAYFRMMRAHVDTVVVQTAVMRHRLVERWGLAADDVRVVPPGLELGVKHPGPKDEPSALPQEVHDLPLGTRLLFYPAASWPHKNLAVLPEAVALLEHAGVQCALALTLARDDPRLSVTMTRAAALHVDRRFLLLGRLPHTQVLELLRSCHALIMPTLIETMGMPYLEAMAVGCPVATSDRDFAREAMGSAAIYFDPHNPESVADAVLRMESETVRTRLVTLGRRRLAQKYGDRSWCRMVEDLLDTVAATIKRTGQL